jgi:hypothetical protein
MSRHVEMREVRSSQHTQTPADSSVLRQPPPLESAALRRRCHLALVSLFRSMPAGSNPATNRGTDVSDVNEQTM